MEWAAWLMKAMIARTDTMPSTTASRIEMLGTTASPAPSNADRTARRTTRQ